MAMDPNVTRLVLARFVSSLGGYAALFIGMWGTAAFKLQATPALFAVLTAVLAVVTIVGGLATGVLVDRYDPRRVMIVAELLFVPTALAAVLVDSMLELILAGAAMVLFSSAVFTAITSFAPYLTDDDKRLVKINSGIESAGLAGYMAGPAVGAGLAHFAGLDWIFVLNAATSLVAVIIVLPIRVRDVEKQGQRRNAASALAEIREGFACCYGNEKLRYFILATTSVWLVLGTFRVLEAVFFRDVLQASASVLGLILSLFGASMVVGSLSVMRLPRFVLTARGVAVLLILNGLGAAMYSATNILGVVVAGSVVWGLVLGIMMTAARTLIHRHSPEPLIGRVAGSVVVHREVAALAPLVAIPAIATVVSVQSMLVGVGLCTAAGGVLFGWRTAVALDKMLPSPPNAEK